MNSVLVGARPALSVGMFTYSTAPRGSVVHAAALAEALARLGCDVTLYALSKGGDAFYRGVACDLQLVPAEPARAGGEVLVRQRIGELASYLASRNPSHDVYHAQDCLTANALLACPLRTLGRVFRTVHHIEQFDCPYLSACQDRSIQNADALCAVSHRTAGEVLMRFARHTWVVGNGVNAERLRATPATEVVAARSNMLAERGGPLLLSVGGVEPRKNTIGMLDAFGQVKRVYPNATWVIVGGATALDHSEYMRAFEALLASSKWQQDVVRVGVLPESQMGPLLGAADVLLNASVQEGFGLTALEALAAGLPVVASNGAPFDEYLSAASAFLVDPSSSKSIASGIVAALRSPIACQLVGRKVAVGHTWRAVAEQTHRAYLHCLHGEQVRNQPTAGALHA